MSTIVIMPGGFHPFHAGHYALYKSAVEAFPNADVYVAATDAKTERPFPFSIKEKLAKVAGVPPGKFVQVKSPFKSEEITQHYDPNRDVLIFVRSEKDRDESPKPGGTKKDGSPSYFQPYNPKNLQPFSRHAYFAYLPTVEFGPGIKSATEIRNAWPNLNDRRKTALVMSLYPATQKNQRLAEIVVKLLDAGMGVQQGMAEGEVVPFRKPQQKQLTWQQVPKDVLLLANDWYWADEDDSGLDAVLDPKGYGNGTANEVRYIAAKLQQKGWTIEHDLEDNRPGQFNIKLTNKNGQSVLLPWSDAQDFTGWAQGTRPSDPTSPLKENAYPRVDLTPNFPNYQVLIGEFMGAQGGKLMLRIADAQLKPGVKHTEKIAKAIAANRPILIAPNYVKNRKVVSEEQYEYLPPGAGATQTRKVISKMGSGNTKFVWKRPNQIGGSFSEQELLAKGFKKSQYNSWGGTQAMWDRLIGIKEDYVDEK